MLPQISRWFALFIFAFLLIGCGPKPPQHYKVMKPPKMPPAPPPRQEVGLDGRLRALARNELLQSLKSGDAAVRGFALEAMSQSAAPDAHTAIIAALDDASERVRFAAAMAAGQLRLSDARARLLTLAGNPSKHVRIAARFALHRLGDTRLSHDLEVFSQDVDPRVRANTVLALGMLGEKSAVKLLRPLRNDPDAAVRLQVAEALWMLGDESGLKNLVGWTISGFPDDQLIAVLALAKPRDPAVREHVRGLLTSDYPEVNIQAARAMGMLGSDEGFAIALNAAKSPDWRQRHLAALAMGAITRPDAQPALAKLLEDPDPIVRIAAAEAILELKD